MPPKRKRTTKNSKASDPLVETSTVLIKCEPAISDPIEITNEIKTEPTVDDYDPNVELSHLQNDSDSDEEINVQSYDPPKKIKRIRRNYSMEDLQKAVKAVKSKEMKMRQAARKYKIPHNTLRDHVLKDNIKKPGSETILSFAEEERIVSWANESASLGHPKSFQDIREAAAVLLRMLNKPGFKSELPSRRWFESFKTRHPELEVRNLNFDINHESFYDKYHAFLESRDMVGVLERKDVFYFIEDTHFDLIDRPANGERRNQLRTVLAKKLQGANHFRNKDSACVTYTFSAEGKMLQPLIIFKTGAVDMMKIATRDQELQAKFLFSTTPDGGHTNQSFKNYLHRLDQQLKDIERPIFIFCAETLPSIDFETSQWLKSKNIFAISFIPREVSPLRICNETIFGIINFGWSEIVKSSASDGRMSHVKFMEALFKIQKNYLVAEKIEEAFNRAGLFPFDLTQRFENNFDESLPKIQRVQNVGKYDDQLKILEEMKKLGGQLRSDLERYERKDLIKNMEVIEQQIKLMKISLGR